MLDFDAYLHRVGLVASPSLTPAALHRAQVTHIPFENLDPMLGVPVSLDQGDLERKLVHTRRGGYCFEQNLRLKSALEEIGAEVEPLLGRMRLGADRDHPRPLTHVALRVFHGGATWLADAGFGPGTLIEPIPLTAGAVHEQSGWRYRLVEDEDGLALQCRRGDEWESLYAFGLAQVPLIDLEVGNWFTSCHPRSPFVGTLRVSRRGQDGEQVMVAGDLASAEGLILTEQAPSQVRTRPVAGSELETLLSERFGITGFGVDERGRLTGPG